MTNTYDTSGDPVGTTSVKALYNNTSNFDEAVNSPGPSWVDRFGKRRETWTGLENLVQNFLEKSGFVYIGDYAAGLTFTSRNQYTVRAGIAYKPAQGTALPFTTTGTWATDQGNFVAFNADATLRDALAAANGSTLVGFQQNGSGAVVRSVQAKLRDVVSIKDFGGVDDGVTDNLAAMQAAHTAARVVYYPGSGTYLCSGKISVSGKFGLQGDGAGITKIRFNGSNQGFDVIQTTADDCFYVDSITFVTDDTTSAFTGLKINGASQISISDGVRGILGDRNKYRGKISNVTFTGSSNSAGWGVGLNLQSIMNFEIQNLTYTGLVPAVVGDLKGVAVLLNGDGAPTDVRIRGLWVFYALYGLLCPDYMEGVHLYDVEMVVVTYGVMGRYTPGYSVASEAGAGCLAFYLDQMHINCLIGGIVLANSNANFFSRLNVYLQPRASDSAARAIQISGGNDHRLRDIFVLGDQAQNPKTGNYGVLLIGVGLSFLDSITASSLLSAVHLQGSSFNEIMNVQSRASLNVVSSDGASTNNSIGPGKAYSNLGSKFPVPLDNLIRMDEHCGFQSVSLTAGPSATITVPLPAGAFSETPRFGTLSIDVSTIGYKVLYQRTSSSSLNAVFLITPAYPATSVPAETIEVSFMLKGI